MRKANNQNRFIRLITLPIRVLTKARDLYVKSMINYAATASYGANGMGIGSGQVSSLDSLPKSFSVNSSRSSYDGDDLRELIRAVSARSLGSTSTGRAEMDLYLQHQMRRRSTAAAATVVPRSCSVGMGRIDEDGPCEFGEESFGGRAELVYPRSRSYAVAAFKSPLICEPNPIPLLNWNFPLLGEVKLNTDGCWFDHDVEPKAGIGGAFRDSMGAWILGFYGKIASQTSLEAELWAIYRGLTIILEKDIALVKMETDSLMAVRLLHGENAKFHKYAGLIEDSKALMTRTGTTISHIPRLANQSADSLSRIGAEQEERLVVTYDIPEAIRPLIREDIMGAGRLQD